MYKEVDKVILGSNSGWRSGSFRRRYIQGNFPDLTVPLDEYGYYPDQPWSGKTTFFWGPPAYNTAQDYGSTLALTDASLFFQRSAVTDLPSDLVRETVKMLYGTRSIRLRKPRPPRYNPPRFQLKAPKVPRLLSEGSFPAVPPFSRCNAAKRAKLQQRIIHRRLVTIERVNSSRILAYNKRQERFEKLYRAFLERKESYETLYNSRVDKYKRRLKLWEAYVERQAKLVLRTEAGSRLYSENEYTRLRLRAAEDHEPPPEIWRWDTWRPGTDVVGLWPLDRFVTPGNTAGLGSVLSSLCCKNIALSYETALHKYVEESDDEGPAVRRLYSKLSNQRAHVGNMLAERKQTFDMIVQLWTTLSSLVTRKRKLLELVGSSLNRKGVSNAILQFKFGVEPLINDISELIDAYLSGVTPPARFKIKSNMWLKDRSLTIPGSTCDFSGSVRVGYTAVLTLDDTPTYALSQFGLIDPRQIAWEVTPWSFVVDWVIPVGDWIMSQTADVGLQSWQVMRSIRALGTFGIQDPAIGGIGFTASTPGTATLSGTYLGELKSRRFVPLPSSDKILFFKNPLSWSHAIEAVALIVQRFK